MNLTENEIRERISLQHADAEKDYARHTFVEAGAGAGKTSLICNRICSLLRNGFYKPEELVVITFTNKAATELYARIDKELGKMQRSCTGEEAERLQYARDNIDRMIISTIHSFCNRILNEQVFYAGRGMGYTLAEQEESTAMQQGFLKRWFAAFSDRAENRELLQNIEARGGKYYYENLIEPAFLAVCDRQDEEVVISPTYREIYGNVSEETLEETAGELVGDFFSEVEGTVYGIYRVSLNMLEEEAIGAKYKAAFADYFQNFSGVRSMVDYLEESLMPAFGEALIRSEKIDLSAYVDVSGLTKKAITEEKRKIKEELNILREEIAGEYKAKAEQLFRIRDVLLYVPVMEVVKQAKDDYIASRSAGTSAGISGDIALVSNDELLHLTKQLVQKDVVVQKFQKQYRCYFVDEFQDTDYVQLEIIRRLTGLDREQDTPPQVTGFFVGDPKQSIYRFRGARVSVFEETKKALSNHPFADVYELCYNFRSNEVLITGVNKAFGNLPNYLPMEASAQGKKSRQGLVHGTYRVSANGEDALMVGELVAQLLDGEHRIYDREEEVIRPVKASDILILLHTQPKIPEYVQALNRRGIQVNASGSMDISGHDVLNRYIGLIGFLANPRDTYAKALGVQSYFKHPVYKYAKNQYSAFVDELWEKTQPYRETEPEKALRELAVKWEWLLPSREVDFYEVCDARIKLTQMLESVLSEEKGTLQEYYEAMCKYRDSEVERQLILDREAEAVRIMNVHKAKGLEAPIVILANRKKNLEFSEDSISVGKQHYHTLVIGKGWNPPKIPGYWFTEEVFKQAKEEEAAEQERLEYVTATRAGEALFLMPILGKDKKPLLWNRYQGQDEAREQPLTVKPKANVGTVSGETVSVADCTALTEQPENLSEEGSLPVTITVNPSGLEHHINKERTEEQGEEEERPKGSIFGTIMHRFFELLAREMEKATPGNRKFPYGKVSMLAYQAGLESSEAIIEWYPETGDRELNRYCDYLKKLFTEGSAHALRLEALLQEAEEIFTELPFSYYLSAAEKAGFATAFGLEIAPEQQVWVNGTSDLVIHRKDGSYQVVDYKSDDLWNMTEEAKQQYLETVYGKQMKLYRYSVAKIFGTKEEQVTSEFFHLY